MRSTVTEVVYKLGSTILAAEANNVPDAALARSVTDILGGYTLIQQRNAMTVFSRHELCGHLMVRLNASHPITARTLRLHLTYAWYIKLEMYPEAQQLLVDFFREDPAAMALLEAFYRAPRSRPS